MEHYVVRRISDQWGLVSGYIGPFATGQGSRGQLWVQAVRKRFPRPKDCTDRVRSPSTRPFEHVFAVGRLESILAQPRAMLSDRNGDTARATAHGPHARIAARSGLIPTMFITRVRL